MKFKEKKVKCLNCGRIIDTSSDYYKRRRNYPFGRKSICRNIYLCGRCYIDSLEKSNEEKKKI